VILNVVCFKLYKGNLMKKSLIALMMVMSGTAFAGSGVTFEFERERSNASGNTMENTVKVAPYVTFGDGYKADVVFSGSRADDKTSGNNSALENSTEARIQKMVKLGDLKVGARLGVGEMFNGSNIAGKTVDYSFYTIEPKAAYAVTNNVDLTAAWRYRNSFSDSVNYQTRTWKVGFDYAVSKNDTMGVKYLSKRGDSDSNGVELVYSRSF
jgi:hypothetical protein